MSIAKKYTPFLKYQIHMQPVLKKKPKKSENIECVKKKPFEARKMSQTC